MANRIPTLIEEEGLRAQGYRFIAGIDEAGRGPLAGPVVASAVILPLEERPAWLSLVRDSKLLTQPQREFLFDCMVCDGVAFGVGAVSHEAIDKHGIIAATKLAMRYAAQRLSIQPDYLLIDAVKLTEIKLPQKSIIKGESISISIAAASVIAKVTRDRLMERLDGLYPGYGLAQHKGYSTPEHLEALQKLGPCPIHRRSFAPVQGCQGSLFKRG
ncbi:MAG: ribonuclease HII [Chloroflexi bacterium]|nr:ribonuclease HII [Chloroflexota bacterium]